MNRRTGTATARLKQDYLRLKKDPVPYVQAEPVPSNILEWHYVIKGPESTPYEGGFYHGKLVFPREFPFQPPSIYMTTPNGRFKINKKLCLSISDFHPDTWNPTWSVSTILIGLLSFMIESSSALGTINTPDCDKKIFAEQSLEYNLRDQLFCELFPDTVATIKKELERRKELPKNARHHSTTSEGSLLIRNEQQMEQSLFHSALMNFAMCIGLAVFAFAVKYVLRNIATQEYIQQ